MARLLILAGIVLIAAGIIWLVAERVGLGRLPGDIVIERGNVRIYIPLMTMLIISVVLSIVMWLINR
ncbi:MAG TPA: DUF2905 domain-containing protein [Hyphomicrobiaceae bacterium]